MGIPGSANPMLFGGAAAYQINQSLRFNSADSANLSKSFTASASCTFSFWVKRANLGGGEQYLFWCDGGAGNHWGLRYDGDDKFTIFKTQSGADTATTSTAVYRDASGWYHIVVNGTPTFYVNGVQVATGSYTWAHIGGTAYIGRRSSTYLNAYLAEFNYIDGSNLTPSSFGETDTITGAWIPKKYSGSYGTNGFYLKFDPSATNGIGHDHSGNGNNWTATGFSTSGTGTDVMSDTPTNNWATLNPLFQASNLTNGNLEYNRVSANIPDVGTIALPANQGKWYWEIVFETTTGDQSAYVFGVVKTSLPRATQVGSYAAYQHASNTRRKYGTLDSGPTWSWSVGDVLGIGIDMTNGDFRLYQNGTLISNWTGAVDTNYDHYPFINGYYAGDKVTVNFGQRAFQQTPPTGHVALNTANLPEPTIKKGSKYFNTTLWSGNSVNGRVITVNDIDNVGFVWTKARSINDNHTLANVVVGGDKYLKSNSTDAELSISTVFQAISSNTFTLGNDAQTNRTGDTYVGWTWAANGAGSSNTAGSITSTVSANATAGFSIVTYTGTGANATVGHGLGVAPKMVIVKSRDTNPSNWVTYHSAANTGNPGYMYLDLTLQNQIDSGNGVWNDTRPTSTVFSVGNYVYTNKLNDKFVAYCFSEVAGYSKFGSYTGNGSSDGPFVFCGFRPRWIMIKRTDSSSGADWGIHDSSRSSTNPTVQHLNANVSDAEGIFPSTYNDFLSNGFKIRGTDAYHNFSGGTYIFAAFAELPAKYSNAR